MLEYVATQQALQDALNTLTPKLLADWLSERLLEGMWFTGYAGSRIECPIACWLQEQLDAPVYVGSHYTLTEPRATEENRVENPPHARALISLIDHLYRDKVSTHGLRYLLQHRADVIGLLQEMTTPDQ